LSTYPIALDFFYEFVQILPNCFITIEKVVLMDSAFREEMKNKLLDMKSEIIHNLMSENEDFKAAVEDMGLNDLADIASNDIDCRTLEAIGTQDKLRLNKVEAALIRLENGKYGVCAMCSSKISIDRLNAIPYAVMCIKCKTDSEKKRNH